MPEKKSILLKQGRIITSKDDFIGDILIQNGKIAKISKSVKGKADKTINCEGKIIFPGMVDTHVHFRDPGLTHKGDSYTESKAAIAGGVTTICDMPNTIPSTTSIKAVKEKQKLYAGKCLCNFGIYIGASKTNLEELKRAGDEETIPAIKIFMAESTGEMTISEGELLKPIFEHTTKLIATHAENEYRRLERLQQFKMDILEGTENMQPDDPYQHAVIRDNLVAAEGTEMAVNLALQFNHRTHILHMSAEEELPFLEEGKLAELVTGETCPQYLWFNREDIGNYAGKRIMNPALKQEKDNRAMWQALQDGLIDQYATDHAPHLLEEKYEPYGKLPAGLPSIQFSLPLLLHAVYQGKLDIQKVPEVYAENPVKNYKIKNKGFLKEGYDADITIIDPSKILNVSDEIVVSECAWTPYEGMSLRGGVVEKTIVNGNLVYDNGKFDEKEKGKTIKVEV